MKKEAEAEADVDAGVEEGQLPTQLHVKPSVHQTITYVYRRAIAVGP